MSDTFPEQPPMTCQEKKIIVKIHNKFRKMVALGKVATQPKAVDMLEMVLFYFYIMSIACQITFTESSGDVNYIYFVQTSW